MMKTIEVIVGEGGFFGGVWFEASKKAQPMREAVAKQFLPPLGEQLSLPQSDDRKVSAKGPDNTKPA